MSEHCFSAEYFQHLLSSLTLNSRALIVELTSLAETYVDNAQEIVDLIEERIQRILPKYKLYTFYLLDSIIKNIGNPYNLLFATNLYKNFTETYSIINDTPTRQNMINLFKTWIGGKTIAGLDLFPKDTLQKVEKFIIRATSLNTPLQPEAPKITRDLLLREGNHLLQYVIALDDEIEGSPDSMRLNLEVPDALHACKLERNNLIFDINGTSESVMNDSKDEFEKKKFVYFECLRDVRKKLDDQREAQKKILQRMNSLQSEFKHQPREALKIKLQLTPKRVDPSFVFGESNDTLFEYAIVSWGKECSSLSTHPMPVSMLNAQRISTSDIKSASKGLASSFGLDFERISLQISQPRTEINEVGLNLSRTSMEDEGDGYDPELTLNECEFRGSQPASPNRRISPPERSSLKREGLIEDRMVKRVRFIE